jgi:hypothetical protein
MAGRPLPLLLLTFLGVDAGKNPFEGTVVKLPKNLSAFEEITGAPGFAVNYVWLNWCLDCREFGTPRISCARIILTSFAIPLKLRLFYAPFIQPRNT